MELRISISILQEGLRQRAFNWFLPDDRINQWQELNAGVIQHRGLALCHRDFWQRKSAIEWKWNLVILWCLVVIMGLVPPWEKEERKWNMHLEPVQEDSFYFKFTMFSWRNCSFLKWVSIWESVCMLCHILFLLVTPSAKARRCMRVMLVSCFSSNCQQWRNYTHVVFIAITLVDYLPL